MISYHLIDKDIRQEDQSGWYSSYAKVYIEDNELDEFELP